ncbi:MAG: acyl-CoA thioesterase [Actinomycetes bacterium]
MNSGQGTPVSASRARLAHVMQITDTNIHGNIHGGVIMKLVDEAAGACAQRHCRGGRAVTVAMDEMVLSVPVHVGDLVTAYASVNGTGKTSMEIGVRVTAERFDGSVTAPEHVASAYLVFVGIDENQRPMAVPAVIPETDEDRRRNTEADIRRQSRLDHRAAIEASRQLR